MKLHEVDTPALIIDLDVMEKNIQRLQTYLSMHNINNRPHIKTHKIPAIAHIQLKAGAIGITCQKLGEAEVMADAGINDILITYNIIGQQKMERLVRLAHRTELTVAIDNIVAAKGMSEAAMSNGIRVNILLELGSELARTGVPTVKDLVELAREVDRLHGVNNRGIMIFPSSLQDADRINEAVIKLQASGFCVDIVSGGGTPQAYQAHLIPHLSEYRAGTYVFNDKMMMDCGAAQLDECALTMLTTVVSRPTSERVIIDAGSKAFSSDGGLPMGYIFEYPKAVIYKMNEEHGYVDIQTCADQNRPGVGDLLRVIPNHVCTAVNLHDIAYGVRNNVVEVIWDIQARGKLR